MIVLLTPIRQLRYDGPYVYCLKSARPSRSLRRRRCSSAQLSFGRFIGSMDGILDNQSEDESGIAITGVDVETGRNVLSFTCRYREGQGPLGVQFPFAKLLELDFQAFWGQFDRTHSTASVRDLRSIKITPVVNSRGSKFEVTVDHSPNADGCHLTCLKSGETSRGPCITCRTERHSIRICC